MYELLIGLRYTRAQPREGAGNRFISFIALISMLGLALGVAALIVVLSVMNGFQKELRERILGVVSHIQVSGGSGELEDWGKTLQGVARHPRVKAAAPYVQAQGMLSFDGPVATRCAARCTSGRSICRRTASSTGAFTPA